MEWRTPFSHDNKAESEATACHTVGESMTIQAHAEDADINVIMRRFNLLGTMPPNHRMPEYGDFSGVNDYQTALNAVRYADEEFQAMPADVRARFHNSPQEFMEFCEDGRNLEEARKLGLAIPAVPAQTTLADVVTAVKETANGPGSPKGGTGN